MRIITIILVVVSGSAWSQSNIEESFDLKGSDNVELSFKWPQLIKVQNWEGNVVKITGSVLINNGDANDRFQLKAKYIDNELIIQSNIDGIEDLPKKIMVKRDGMSYYFDTNNWDDPEVRKFMNDKGQTANEYVTRGVIKEIEINVYLPKSVQAKINAKYGLVELNDLESSIDVNAKYGGIDAALGSSGTTSLEARTRYGEIYSDLPYDLSSNNDSFNDYHDKWTVVTYQGKKGSAVLESKYGSVYLRQKRGG